MESMKPVGYMTICGAFDNKSEDLQFNKYRCYWDYGKLKAGKSLIELLKKEK